MEIYRGRCFELDEQDDDESFSLSSFDMETWYVSNGLGRIAVNFGVV